MPRPPMATPWWRHCCFLGYSFLLKDGLSAENKFYACDDNKLCYLSYVLKRNSLDDLEYPYFFLGQT